jgi:hypothetical protein
MKNQIFASRDRLGRCGISIQILFCIVLLGAVASAQTVRVDVTPGHAIKFDPDQALGSSMDILQASQVDTVYSEPILKESLSAGWGPITCRQNTELTIAAWHWNSNGTWSDPAHRSGYFTGTAEPKEFLRHSFGYSLPHRGSTRSDASQGKYSRLTDGDPASYWKSNPYLTKRFTGEEDSHNPQWIVIDFGTPHAVKRPGGEWSLMLINKDPSNAYAMKIEFADASVNHPEHFTGPVTMVTFGAEQYVWHPDGPKSHADPDGPAARKTITVKSGNAVTLPRASVTVLRGKID